MLLTPVELELILILKTNQLFPKTKEELLDAMTKLDELETNIERVIRKSNRVCYNITSYFEDYNDEQIVNLLNNIIK